MLRLLIVLATVIGLVAVASPAQAAGTVVNSCAAEATVLVATKTSDGGINLSTLRCGQGKSGVYWATVPKRPFYVKLPGTPPLCLKAGQYFYPNNPGNERAAIVTPTVRCR